MITFPKIENIEHQILNADRIAKNEESIRRLNIPGPQNAHTKALIAAKRSLLIEIKAGRA